MSLINSPGPHDCGPHPCEKGRRYKWLEWIPILGALISFAYLIKGKPSIFDNIYSRFYHSMWHSLCSVALLTWWLI